jgi:hypothetical protein
VDEYTAQEGFAQGKIVDGSRNAWRFLWWADLSFLVNAP